MMCTVNAHQLLHNLSNFVKVSHVNASTLNPFIIMNWSHTSVHLSRSLVVHTRFPPSKPRLPTLTLYIMSRILDSCVFFFYFDKILLYY